MPGKTVTKDNVTPALEMLLPVFEWVAAYQRAKWVAIRMCASFGAPLFVQKNMFGDALVGAPDEILSRFAQGWPLYEQEELEGSQ